MSIFAISIYLLIPSYTLITFCELNMQYSLYYWQRIKNKMGKNFVLWRFVLVWQTWPANQVELYFMSHHVSWLPKVKNSFTVKTLKKLQRLTYSVTMKLEIFIRTFTIIWDDSCLQRNFWSDNCWFWTHLNPYPSLLTYYLLWELLLRIQSLYSYNYSAMTMEYWFILTLRF